MSANLILLNKGFADDSFRVGFQAERFNKEIKSKSYNYNNYKLTVENKINDNHEIKFSLNHQELDFISPLMIEIDYFYFFNPKWEMNLGYKAKDSFALDKNYNEVVAQAVQFNFLLGYSLISRKNYRFRIFSGIGVDVETKMEGSIDGQVIDKKESLKSGLNYIVNPILEFRDNKDIRYSIGYHFEKSNLETQSLPQSQDINKFYLGVSFPLDM